MNWTSEEPPVDNLRPRLAEGVRLRLEYRRWRIDQLMLQDKLEKALAAEGLTVLQFHYQADKLIGLRVKPGDGDPFWQMWPPEKT